MATPAGHGQKVTTDPRSKQVIHESTGLVTSDSLAAESLKGEDGFASDNPHAAASGVPSKATTSNTTDTSNATRLAPAVDAEAREAQEGWSETSQLNASRNINSGGETGFTTGEEVKGGYAGASDGARTPGDLKPKGKNITEGGFDSDGPNASFNNAEIGSKKDPGRVAEAKFGLENARSGADAGRAKDTGLTGDSQFDALERSEEA
ncbi:hypothetical protein K504DRAFT_466445 [Pleomassaria siparia CBS 279.74]|uniref:Uncharacterized protein n=1 Tax=Pleomassaria siparia CBS 279.74 TaxID=1314801 RepID=A0A6G1KB56_9PLEO|nr:hypothetical protein K504DRAFT_466445 [Pleomassaria siparia CBS 279.74]